MSGRSSEKVGKRRANTNSRYGDGFKGFVDIPLSEKDREEIQYHAQPGQVDIEAFLAQVISDGYKFSLVADFEHSCCIATLTGRSEGCENKDFALSGRGPDAQGAVVCLWYKHSVLAHWGTWTDQGSQRSDQLPLWS